MSNIKNEAELMAYMEVTKKEVERINRNIRNSFIQEELEKLNKSLDLNDNKPISSRLLSKLDELQVILES